MEQKLNHFFNFISVIAITSFAIPLVYVFLGGVGIPHSALVLPILTFGTVMLGYFLQHGMAAVLGQQLSRDGRDSERNGIMNGFKVSYALLPILIVVGLSFLVNFGFSQYLYYLFKSGVIDHYDRMTAFPYVAMILFILCAVGGIVIWFYPMERLSNIYVLIVGVAVFIIEFALTFTVYFDNSVITMVVVSFSFFVACMMLIYNQSNLQKTYMGSVVSVISPASRFYNMLLVGVLLVALVLALGLSYVVLSGVFILFRALFYLILYKLFYGYVAPESDMHREYVDMEEQAGVFTREVMDTGSQYMLALFFTIACVIVIVIIGIRAGWLQRLLRYIYDILADFFNTVKIGRELMKDISPFDDTYNYKDQKKKIQKASINEYLRMAETTDSYKLFLQRLAKLPDYEAQLSFAYAMLVTVCRKSSVNLKISDTPREVKSKVTHMIAEEEIAVITREFEAVKYAEEELSSAAATALLNRICAIVKRYIF